MEYISGETYNVMLFGETGVGKSTFINAFEHYIKYNKLDDALESSRICCRIPVKFTWQNSANFEDTTIEYGHDQNENLNEVGMSATQTIKRYDFQYKNKNFSFFDTPGFSDTRGYEAEIQNVKNMLTFMKSQLGYVHALCILLKPDENRETVKFRYCMMQFFRLFHREFCKNIIFVFTHSSATDYKINSTKTCIESVFRDVEDILGVRITFNKTNAFCVDNKCFKYLLAVKLEKDSLDDAETYTNAWEISRANYIRLLEYIQTLPVCSTQNTLDINDSRDKLEEMYYEKLKELENRLDECKAKLLKQDTILQSTQDYINRLKLSLYNDVITIRGGPDHIICKNKNCRKKGAYGIHGKACCPNCTRWFIFRCDAFIDGYCKRCGCSKDLHIFLGKPVFEEKEKQINTTIEKLIQSEEELLRKYIMDKFLLKQSHFSIDYNIHKIKQCVEMKIDFLKENCIVIYTGDHINQLNMEINSSVDEQTKVRLTNYLHRYQGLYELCQK